jgi:hypothetical protein
MSKGRKFNKNGMVNAYDFNHTGQEPDWSDADKLTSEQINDRMLKGLNFYNYYLDRDDLHKCIMEYMATYHDKFKAEDIKKFRSVSKEIQLSTEGKIARMLLMGMPDVENVSGKTATSFVDSKIATCIRYVETHQLDKKKDEEDAKKPKAPVVPPMKRLEEKVYAEVICHIDWALDEWLDDYANVAPVGVTSLLGAANIPSKGCKFVTYWLDRYLIDLYDAKSGECDQCVEAYSFLTKVQLNKWIRTFEKMKAEVEKYEKANKKAIVRTKKVKPAIQQVQNLKYLTEDNGTKSVPPVRICGAMVLYTYNVKTNKVAKYEALTRNGLSVKGTSIKDFDTDKSYTFTVRKNIKDDVFKQLNKKDVIKGMDNIKESTKTKVAIPNGRINEHTLLLFTK